MIAAWSTDLIAQQPAVRTVTVGDLAEVAAELAAYQAHFAPLFRRREQRVWGELYLRGLLVADVPRKNSEALALRLLGAGADAEGTVRAVQQFLGAGGWDDAALLAVHQRLVDETLGADDGVLIIDGSDVPKQGDHSVGVARQWCGHTGKQDNCQAGVYLGYASAKGYTLLDRRLYLPACWFTPAYAERWHTCGIPRGTPFRTKHDLAEALVAELRASGRVRARWVVCDEGFGDSPALLDRWGKTGLHYLAEVARDTQVWPLTNADGTTPRAEPTTWVPPQTPSKKGPAPVRVRLHPASPPKQRVDEWAVQVPAARWQRYRLLEGSKGPLIAAFVAVPIVTVRRRLPGPPGWLLVRRSVPSDPTEQPTYKYYLSNAPAATPLATLVWVSGMRWPIEACFTATRQEVGFDHYETRSWRGWHHHLTLVLLAHHFLVRLQQRLDPREGGLPTSPRPATHADTPAGPAAHPGPHHPKRGAGPPTLACLPPVATAVAAPGHRAHRLPSTPETRRLPGPAPQSAPPPC